jgi:hypothetical protein
MSERRGLLPSVERLVEDGDAVRLNVTDGATWRSCGGRSNGARLRRRAGERRGPSTRAAPW